MKAELLAPAGSYGKLKTALYFGADAAYIGGKQFSLRTFADNFTAEELRSAVDFAHGLGKKIYVTANVFARNGDFTQLGEYFQNLSEIRQTINNNIISLKIIKGSKKEKENNSKNCSET